MPVKTDFSANVQPFVDGVTKADRALDLFGTTAMKTSNQTKQWQTSLSQADALLAKGGVNIGNTTKALDELSGFAGKTAKEIGAFGTAAGVAGAAMAGWEFGRAIAGWLGLDEAIGKATASLLGWGDLAAETAGAKQDAINSAIEKGGKNITSYAAAVAYLTEWQKKRLAVAKEDHDAHEKTLEAMKELNSVGGDFQQTLEGINGDVVEGIKYYLEAGVAQGTLATAYGLTATQVKAVAESLKAAEAADKAWLEGMKAAAEEADTYAKILADLANRTDLTAAADERALAKLTAKTDAITQSILAESAARDSLQQSVVSSDELTQAWVKMNAQLEELEKNKVGDIDTSARQQVIYRDYVNTVNAAIDAQSKMPAALDQTTAATQRATQAAGAYMQQLSALVNDPKLAAFFGSSAQGSVAATLYGGGNRQGSFTPQESAAMAAGQFINFAGVGNTYGGRSMQAAPIVNNFNVNGTAQDVAKTIANQIMSTMKAGGKVTSS